jgi:UDP-glucose 4-epimerase
MHYLITGGAGFLGSHLANTLAQAGHEVRVLDDLTSGDKSRLDPRILFTRGDINNIPKLWSLLQGVDCVYHLAARVSVAESKLYPRDYNHVNVGGTVSLMEAMRDANVRRLVFASSGAVYGTAAEQPVRETTPPAPDSPYAASKLAAEHYVQTIGGLWGLQSVVLRIFNAYGPYQNLPVSHAPVVPRFVRQAVTGGSVVLFGGGEQTRDFVYVTDVVAALVQAGGNTAVNPSPPHPHHTILNIGSGQETSLNQLVDSLEQLLQTNINRLSNHEQQGGVPRLVADISRAQQQLKYTPQISLPQGLRQMITQDPRFALGHGLKLSPPS